MKAAYAAQGFAVDCINALALAQRRIDVLELQQPEGRIDFAHLPVDAGLDNGDFVDKAEGLQVVDVLLGLHQFDKNVDDYHFRLRQHNGSDYYDLILYASPVAGVEAPAWAA